MVKSKPIVCIVAKIDENKNTQVPYEYVYALEKSGAVPVVLPNLTNKSALLSIALLVDGFLFTGGVDIAPLRYGETLTSDTVDVCKERDEFDFAVLDIALSSKKPILAICRGIQLINVAFGGTLYQDLVDSHKMAIRHKQIESRTEFSHYVNLNGKLQEILGKDRIRVNSFHHQAIKRLGKGLRTVAYADDGVVEGVVGTEQSYLMAYQWHPELLFDKDESSKKLFADFVCACKEYKTNKPNC